MKQKHKRNQMPKKLLTQTQKIDLLCEKLDLVHTRVEENAQQIKELKEQVDMGRGGIKVVFLVGALVAAAFTMFKFGKLIA